MGGSLGRERGDHTSMTRNIHYLSQKVVAYGNRSAEDAGCVPAGKSAKSNFALCRYLAPPTGKFYSGSKRPLFVVPTFAASITSILARAPKDIRESLPVTSPAGKS